MKTLKERAQALLGKFNACKGAEERKNLGWKLAEFVEELANAPEPEPVAFQVRNGWASVAIYQRQIDAENYAKDQQQRHDLSGSLASFRVVPLYTAPPAPKSEPIAYIEHHKGGDNLVWDNPGGEYSALYPAPPAPSVPDEELQAAFDRGLKAGNEQKEAQQVEIHRIHDLLAAAPTPAEAPADVARDAARYQWLRRENAKPGLGFYVGDDTDTMPGDITWIGSDLDAAIDAAMSEKGGA